MAESEQRKSAARLQAMKCRGLFFTEGAEFAGAALDDGRRHVVRQSGSASAGTDGVRENVEIAEGARFDDIHGGGMVVLGLAGEASYAVDADSSVLEWLWYRVEAAGA